MGTFFCGNGAFSRLQTLVNFLEFMVRFRLKAQVIDAGCIGGRGNGEVDARIIEHPFGVIAFLHARRHAEHGGIKACALFKVADGDVDMKAFHDFFLFEMVGEGFCTRFGVQSTIDDVPDMHAAPAQQFSVRYSTKPFTVEKFAE